MNKEVRWHQLATNDYFSIVAWYTDEAGDKVAERFVRSLRETEDRISRNPGLGPTSFTYGASKQATIHGAEDGLPYLVFYLDLEEHIEIVRVLHERRDFPGQLQD
ncbi:MAG: type II toxin-antitoxin system RelE/ParE family toxin [Scrofimicrobium sp.]